MRTFGDKRAITTEINKDRGREKRKRDKRRRETIGYNEKERKKERKNVI